MEMIHEIELSKDQIMSNKNKRPADDEYYGEEEDYDDEVTFPNNKKFEEDNQDTEFHPS